MHKLLLIQEKEILIDEDVYEQIKNITISLNKKRDKFYVYVLFPKQENPMPLHVFVMGAERCKGFEVDHRDRNPLNNLRSNLRIVTSAQNKYNQPAFKGKEEGLYKSKYKGVSWHKQRNKWRAYISHFDRSISLGLYDSEIVATYAYDEAAKILSKGVAMLNNAPKDNLTEHELATILCMKNMIEPQLSKRRGHGL